MYFLSLSAKKNVMKAYSIARRLNQKTSVIGVAQKRSTLFYILIGNFLPIKIMNVSTVLEHKKILERVIAIEHMLFVELVDPQ